jgi:GPH family glycoside/pentoside/hexuronide:cation symporter
MLAGAVIAAITSIVMWYPPLGQGEMAVNLFVVGMLALLFTVGYSLFTIPYTAMGYEMSTDSDERTHLFKYRLIFYTAAMLVTPWLARLCLEIEGDQAATLKGIEGVRWVSIGVAAAILVSGLIPVFFCRDVIHVSAEKKVPFFDAVKYTFRNKAFQPLILGNFLMRAGMCVSGIFFYYVFVYRIGGSMKAGATAWGWFVTAITLATLAGTPAVAWLAQHWGKKQTTMALMLASAVAYGSMWWTFTPGSAALHLYLITAVGIGIFCNTLPMVINSMLADVCDADELESGARREAFYGAVFVTCDKLAYAFALLLQGFLLNYSGFNAKLETQTPETVTSWMKWLVATQPTGFVLGVLCILAYPLTRARLREIRAELDTRHAR